MDALSSIFSAARLSGRIDSLTTFALPWGVLFEEAATPRTVVHLVAEGTCCLRTGGHLPEYLGTGDLVIVPSGGSHILSDHPESRALPLARARDRNAALLQTYAGQTLTLMTVTYAQDMAGKTSILTGLPEPLILRAEEIAKHPQLSLLVDLMRSEAKATGAGSGLVLPRLLDSLLALALRAWLETGPQDLQPSWLKGLTDPGIAQALADMHDAPSDDWTLRTMALSAGLARATFARRFSDLVGETPVSYLNRWRMVLAAHRIKDGELSVEAAAQAHGYASAAAFSRAFRRTFGMPPSRLRQDDKPAKPRSRTRKTAEPLAVVADVAQLPERARKREDDDVVLTPPAFMTQTSGAA